MSLIAPAEATPDIRWPRKTRAEELRLMLADEIVRGALTPGAALDETTLARRFDVSRTPVREAIRLLAASGLVEVRAHRAAMVARPSAEQLAGMFEVMAELEALCAGFAAERMTSPERRALEDEHEKLRVLIQSGDPQRYHEVNEAFHNCIYTGAHNTYLAEITLATRARVQPFRRAQFRNLGGSPSRMSNTTAWWRRFCAASRRSRARPCTRTSSPCARNMSTIPRRSEY